MPKRLKAKKAKRKVFKGLIKPRLGMPEEPIPTGAVPKLTGKNKKYRMEIIRMLAAGYSPSLVVQEMKDNYGITLSRITIYQTYLKGKAKLIEFYKSRMALEVMKNPLANKNIRLGYILKALNHALTWKTDKLYFSFGKLIGHTEKIDLGVVAQLIREAREETEGASKTPPQEVKVSLLQIIREIGQNADNIRKAGPLGNRIGQGNADSLDQPGLGDIQIL